MISNNCNNRNYLEWKETQSVCILARPVYKYTSRTRVHFSQWKRKTGSDIQRDFFFFALCAKLHIVLFVFFRRERLCPPSLINHCETCAVTSNRNTICQDIRPLKAPLTAFTTITSRELETLCPSKSQGHHPFYPLCCWVLWLKTRPLSTVNFREPTADFLFTEL